MRNVFIITALLISMTTLGQEVVWGEEFKLKNNQTIRNILGNFNGNWLIFKAEYKNDETVLFLEEFSGDHLSRNWSKEISLPYIEDKGLNLQSVGAIGDTIYVFATQYNNDTKIQSVYGLMLNLKGEIVLQPTMLDSVYIGKNKLKTSFAIELSPDNQHILVHHNKPFEKYANEKFSFKVYDVKLNQVLKKEIELPYKDQFFNIHQYLIDDDDRVFMLAGFREENVKGRKMDYYLPSNNYVLITYDFKTNTLKEFNINLGNKWVNAVNIDLNKEGKLLLGGFYSVTADNNVAGTFYLRINPATRKVERQGLKTFSSDFLSEFSEGARSKEGDQLESFYFDHFISTQDNGAIFTAERFYVSERMYTDPRTGYVTYNNLYYYNDIIVVKVNEQGDISWTTRVPKRQHSIDQNSGFMSYAISSSDSTVNIIFNDHPNNMQVYETGEGKLTYLSNPRKSISVCVSINENGDKSYKALFKSKEQNLVLKPRSVFQENNQFYFFGQNGNNYRFGKVDL